MSEHIEHGIRDCNEALNGAANDTRLIAVRHANVAARLGRAASLMGEVTAILASCGPDLDESSQAARSFLNHILKAEQSVAPLRPQESANAAIRALPERLADLHGRGEYSGAEHVAMVEGQQMLVKISQSFKAILDSDVEGFEASAHTLEQLPEHLQTIQMENLRYLQG